MQKYMVYSLSLGTAVLLALYDKELDYDLSVRPPYDVFKKWGVYMPAVSLNEEPWEIESTEILMN